MIDRNFRKVKNISKDLEEHYKKYYLRNVGKFFCKWGYKEKDLSSTFIRENEEFSIIGQVSETLFILKNNGDESRWFASGEFLASEFSRKEE